ncbi:uncharacterized protein E0L32_002754 [Thyridium curvatum]|uniref:U3 small nucleolar RNA-associated protein 22 n=1 Tax=Thyridium curvatum TaxID=1093900 RepID=A0A507B546_9PEZI|nr:uncharacterized protein E0L32_002754 [Thyridium curvatum]TPX18245.1 hypothetical protein E0L32_002754 [Thyridium curvatum]
MEEASPKRRKLDHSSSHSHAQSLTYDSAASAGLYRPSTFILETEELLKEIRVDYGRALSGADSLLHDLKNAIESNIESHAPTPIAEATSKFEKKHNITIPYPEPKPAKDAPYKLLVEKPSQFNVVGSYVSKTMVKSQQNPSVDMIVEMPKELFQEKDYANMRYFYKRAYFLANIAAAAKGMGQSTKLSFELLGENPLLPVIVLEPSATDKKGKKSDANASSKAKPGTAYIVRIIPCHPEGVFLNSKLSPSNNCLRQASNEDEKAAQTPTPFYNSTLKADSTYLAYLRFLRTVDKSCAAFKDVCLLGRTFLQQRGFGGSVSRGGFGNFEWAVLVGLLLQTVNKKGASALSPSLSSTQLFKATIQFLATTDLSKKPCVLGSLPEGAESVRESGPVIYDAQRHLNIAYKMSPWSSTALRQHAKWTLDLLSSTGVDQFNPTFIVKADVPLQSFDQLFQINIPRSASSAAVVDRRGHTWNVADRVFRILKRALGDRVKLVDIQLPSKNGWPLDKKVPSDSTSALTVGLLYDPANASRQVDHGPSVEEKKEAKKFRQFWGDKAELRKFKDGSILETLIWQGTTPADLCEEIVRYIMGIHLRLDDDDFNFLGGDFTALVPLKQTDPALFTGAREAFSQVEQDIRGLEDLPLQVRQLAPIAPQLRSASVKPPVLGSAKVVLSPMDIVIFFEASGKWPDNLSAIQRAKIAFLLKIGESLEEARPGVTTHIGMEEIQSDIQNLAFLDIVYPESAAFRLRIHGDLEEALLERRTKDKTLDQNVRTEAVHLLATFKRLYATLPLHNQMISTAVTRFPALSPTIRLVKSWFNAHKLSHHFNEDLIELAVLHVFVEPYPWQAPSSPATGFLRTLLFLSRWDWRTEPLVVDASSGVDDFSPADRAAAATRLEAWRKIDPNMHHTVLFAATPHDASGTAYTTRDGQPHPSRVAATRMTTLARSACRLVKEAGAGAAGGFDPRQLCQTPLRDYDVLLHLEPRVVKAVLRGDDGTARRSHFKNLDERAVGAPLAPVPAHPVAALLRQLEAAYGSALVFFHGGPDDAVVGGIWNPQVHRRSFRVNMPCSFRPASDGEGDDDVDDHDVMEVDREGILAEIARVGGDVIEKIETRGSS